MDENRKEKAVERAPSRAYVPRYGVKNRLINLKEQKARQIFHYRPLSNFMIPLPNALFFLLDFNKS